MLIFDICTGIEKAIVTIEEATAASSYKKENYVPHNLIDSNVNTYYHSIVPPDPQKLLWVQLELSTLQNVTKIYVTNRKKGYGRFINVTVRVGDKKVLTEDKKEKQQMDIFQNEICNTFHGPGNDGEIKRIYCKSPISGKFVTIQELDKDVGFMNIAEVEVYRSILVDGMSNLFLKHIKVITFN